MKDTRQKAGETSNSAKACSVAWRVWTVDPTKILRKREQNKGEVGTRQLQLYNYLTKCNFVIKTYSLQKNSDHK